MPGREVPRTSISNHHNQRLELIPSTADSPSISILFWGPSGGGGGPRVEPVGLAECEVLWTLRVEVSSR